MGQNCLYFVSTPNILPHINCRYLSFRHIVLPAKTRIVMLFESVTFFINRGTADKSNFTYIYGMYIA